jgi:16S rRNA (adenine1518-N6/adenine1519-N6)-dimethyltransferase
VFVPSKRLGQNFLVDLRVVERILGALGPRNDETIIEIGPGKGALTDRLVERAGRVVAIEFDRNLGPLLAERLASKTNFKLVQDDALQIDLCSEIQPATQARVVANLPYNISTAILQRLIDQRQCLSEMVLMLQREVVDRMTAPAGSTEHGYLSVLVEAYCEASRLFDVAPGAFKPVPKVWSSVVRLIFRPQPAADVDERLLWQVVSAGFAQKRKTILNNLRHASEALQNRIKPRGGASIILCEANIEPVRRAETLTIDEWRRLTRLLE